MLAGGPRIREKAVIGGAVIAAVGGSGGLSGLDHWSGVGERPWVATFSR